jgi:hypothetical protein
LTTYFVLSKIARGAREGSTHAPRQACSFIESCVTKPTSPFAAPVRPSTTSAGTGTAGGWANAIAGNALGGVGDG